MKDEEMKEKFILNKDHPRYLEMIRKWNKTCVRSAQEAHKLGEYDLAKHYWSLLILEF